MNRELPAYYHSLGPFLQLFGEGLPILTYHHLGPRPGGVRLKGLYLGEKLFARQLAELRAAGFTSGSLPSRVAPGENAERPVVLTFDDGFHSILQYGLMPLAENRFRGVVFLVADLLGKTNEWDLAAGEVPARLMDVAQVRDWLAEGHDIGSHTLSHPFLTKVSKAQARKEVRSSKAKLEDIFGRCIRHFCYPYDVWNQEMQDLVAEAGYKTGCTTELGVNPRGTDPLALRRFTARYPSRKLKDLWRWLTGK